MAIKGVINESRISVAKFSMIVQPGVGEILFTTIGALEEELDSVELPDRTVRTGGRKKPIEFEVTQPAHHDDEVAAMEAWYVECQDPVSPTHLKTGTLVSLDIEDAPRRTQTLTNLWVMKKATAEKDLSNDGDMDTLVWTLKCDEIV